MASDGRDEDRGGHDGAAPTARRTRGMIAGARDADRGTIAGTRAPPTIAAPSHAAPAPASTQPKAIAATR